MENPLLPKNDFEQKLINFDIEPKNVKQQQYTINVQDQQIRVEPLMELPQHSTNPQEQQNQFKVLLNNYKC